ncbi:hypothetical protein KY285_000847 [Solanum tuberosum]|nr:hypothetical protein KY289_001030 [Solanum tuberosum]KAH0764976.1 hypothetical protein KY285_000847 [Solanum tuberosum]
MGDINAGNRGLNDPLNLDNVNRAHGIEDDAEHFGLLTKEFTAFLLKWKTKWIKIMEGRGDC